jgi:protein-S-isoprenylcysteine O-methyltransferase Ste14
MRWLTLSYGLLAYLFGIRSVVYFVLFASNVPLVKTVDSGPSVGLTRALAVDSALLLLFALTHSLMARDRFKQVYRRLASEATLRSTYVLVSAITLSLLMWQWSPIDLVVWEIEAAAGRYLLIGVAAMGWSFAAVAYYSVGHLELFGLRQAWLRFKGRPEESPRLVTSGIYRVSRNPMYLGFVIGMWSTPRMSAGHLLLSAVMTIYVLIGRRYEKRDLIARFGDRYLDYVG